MFGFGVADEAGDAVGDGFGGVHVADAAGAHLGFGGATSKNSVAVVMGWTVLT